VNQPATIQIGPWTAYPSLNQLERGGRSVKIEPRAMDVLVFLAQHHDVVVSVDEVIAAVWKGVVVGDGSVYLAIRQLRQVLDDPDGTSFIETIPKRGYRLRTAPFVRAAAETTTRPMRRWWIGAGLAGAAIVAALLFYPREAPPDTETSIAVLPFENLSTDPEQAYFADGVTEEILNKLSGIRDLRVTGRSSSFQFKDRQSDLRAIGKALGVEHVLEGTVRKAGDQVRVSANLSNAGTGEQLWSEIYERQLDDVFEIQDEIAKSVAKALQIKLGVGDLGRVPGMTRNVAAYDEYLRAMALNLERDYGSGIAHLQRAVALDPSFSMAWMAQNAMYANGALSMPPDQAEEWRRLGEEALEHARALTPDVPNLLLLIGIREARRCNWVEAAPLYDALPRAHEKHGSANQAWGPRGVFLSYVGREREAIPMLERARAEDPLVPMNAVFLARAYLSHGNTEAALAEVERGLGMGGMKQGFGNWGFWIALSQDDRPGIERWLQLLRESPDGTGRLSRVLGMAPFLDSPSDALAEIRRIAALDDPNDRVVLALWAAHIRAPELSLELMAKESRNGESIPALWLPLMRDVRKLPAFKELARKAGLVDYWRAYGWPDYCKPVGAGDFNCS
jgi:TolB-like protein/DNA-binding winged helix-turn-helix (wHTH) protein